MPVTSGILSLLVSLQRANGRYRETETQRLRARETERDRERQRGEGAGGRGVGNNTSFRCEHTVHYYVTGNKNTNKPRELKKYLIIIRHISSTKKTSIAYDSFHLTWE